MIIIQANHYKFNKFNNEVRKCKYESTEERKKRNMMAVKEMYLCYAGV